ncbi:unnamed protein product [Arabidopsis arenosa]|uniref:Brf1 TBP-binding domain-containing protein n=1 Tax=Arabidopsis arenosa TaxID=38785 RepID=A0A8S1ZVX2_ARAAE|nr:unnamed protein product [Arabidopsis arenosa]
MVWCNHCGKIVPGTRPYDGTLACDLCGRILENFNFSSEVTFVKNAAGQFINVVGRSDPRAFQRAEKERMGKDSREENEGGIEKSEGETDGDDRHAEDSDEVGNLFDIGDVEVKGCFLTKHEKILTKISWELINRDNLEKQAAKEAALKTASEALNASNANCSEYARNLVETSKADVKNSRKEQRQKGAMEAKNAPPSATAMEAVHRTLEKRPFEKSPKRSKPRQPWRRRWN